MVEIDSINGLLNAVRNCLPQTGLWAELCFEVSRALFDSHKPSWQRIRVGRYSFEAGSCPGESGSFCIEYSSAHSVPITWNWCWSEAPFDAGTRSVYQSLAMMILNWISDIENQPSRLLETTTTFPLDQILFDNHPVPIWIYDRKTLQFLAVNDSAIAKYGFARTEFLSMTIADIRPPEDVPALLQNISKVTDGFNIAGIWRHRTKDGRILKVDVVAHTLEFQGRSAEIVMATDMTTVLDTEEKLRSMEEKLNSVFETETNCLKIVSPDGRLIRMNPAGRRLLDVEDESQILGAIVSDFVLPPDRGGYEILHRKALLGMTVTGSFHIRGLMGKVRRVESTCTPLMGPGGHITSVLSVTVDQTESDLSRRLIEEKDERLRLLSTLTSDVFWDWNPLSGFTWRSDLPAAQRSVDGHLVALTTSEWASRIHPSDRDRVVTSLMSLAENEERIWHEEYRAMVGADKFVIIDDRGFAVRGQHGRLIRMVGTSTDVTDRRRLEDTLLRRQKLEAVGLLAGGVAHDFNNLLLVILGYTDVIQHESRCPARIRKMLDEIQDAALRAKGLTGQLLAFGRRQHLRPERIDLKLVIERALKVVRRLISPDIDVAFEVQPNVSSILFDVAQFMQVIVNLATNAADAMPEGGTIRIIARNHCVNAADAVILAIDPGPYVELAFSDTGMGITNDIKDRIFEPFFTTKELGKGTGLGLSTVYGIVKQSEGAIYVESELGRGTTFQILLKAQPQE